MPLISRDEIKEGYVNTYGLKHDELPTNTNGLVSELFFGIVNHYLEGNISVVIEAAFQHHVWEPKITKIIELAHALFCDRRYDTVFVYHNGAESYYAARGFRGSLKV